MGTALKQHIPQKKTTNKTSTTIKICRNTKLSVSVVRLSFVWLILERLKTILQAVKAVNWEVSNKNMASFGCSYRTLYKPLFWPPCPLILNQKATPQRKTTKYCGPKTRKQLDFMFSVTGSIRLISHCDDWYPKTLKKRRSATVSQRLPKS